MTNPPWPRTFNRMSTSTPLAKRILWGLVIGVVAAVATLGIGQLHPPTLALMQKLSAAVFDPLGQIFLRMPFFVVIPLVFTSLASGVAQLGGLDRLGPLAGQTFLLFFLNMGIAVAIGLVMMNTVPPAHHLDEQARTQLMQEYGSSAQQSIDKKAAQPGMSFGTLVAMFMPRNLVGAVAGPSRDTLGDVLPLGATMNMSGTALFEGCVVLFVARAFGVELTLSHQAILMLLSVLSAVAVAGIPGGSLPMTAGLLATFGIPPEGSDIVTATVVDHQLRDRLATP